ncbi:alpha/beta fold hydrolase [Microbacterium sp. BWT-B31]|uniref:alpha/beta fold hydrolase n=1 Tax=Microbacterium sp. BWT-B31 TaxID=3232072 RepID=UPI003526CB6D
MRTRPPTPHDGARGWRHPLIALAVGTLVTLTVAGPAAASAPSVRAWDAASRDAAASPLPLDAVDPYVQVECAVEIPAAERDRVSCGTLTVPESRAPDADPERVIELPVIRIAARAARPAADPLVFPTSGGPGGGSVSALWYFLDHADWATDDREVILVEQRGDQASDPTLDCPENSADAFPVDGAWPTGSAGRARYLSLIEECHQRLIADGVNLAAYTSAASAADLADLRAAIGYGAWNLYGTSYGARLALTAMRDHPDGLRSVILDGVYPPNVNRYEVVPAGFLGAVGHLFDACADAVGCRTAYPDLEESLRSLLERTAREPITITVDTPDGTAVTLDLDDTAITAGLFDAFYDAGLVRVLPFVIDRLAKGDDSVALPLAQRFVDSYGWLSEGLDLSIECAEEVPFTDETRLSEELAADPLLEHLSVTDRRDECELWQVPAAGEGENARVSSSIPTLLMSGGYDPITPASWADAAAATLENHYSFVFPTQGHGSVWANWYDPCAASMAEEFLDDPSGEPDSACVGSARPAEFVVGDGIDTTSAVFLLNRDVLQQGEPLQIAILLSTLALTVATLVYTAVYGLRRVMRGAGTAPAGAVPAAAFSSGLYVAYLAAMAIVVLSVDQLVAGFGLPSWTWPFVVLPYMAFAGAVLLVVTVVRAWVDDDGGVGHRVFLSLSALALVGLGVWLLVRGFLTP